eukprot:1575774-Rhodomonas_salina.1
MAGADRGSAASRHNLQAFKGGSCAFCGKVAHASDRRALLLLGQTVCTAMWWASSGSRITHRHHSLSLRLICDIHG